MASLHRITSPYNPIGPIGSDAATAISGDIFGAPAARSLATGFKELDDRLTVLHCGDLTVLAARPAMGKTAFSLNIVTHAACKLSRSVLVVSLDANATRMASLLICSHAEIDIFSYSTGSLSDAESERATAAAEELGRAPLYISDKAAPSVSDIERLIDKIIHENGGIGLVLIDWLQHLTWSDNPKQTQARYAEVLGKLKSVAERYDTPVLITSQLSRAPEKRNFHLPLLSDLLSAEIRRYADTILSLYVEGLYDSDSMDRDFGVVSIMHDRYGAFGSVKLRRRFPATLGFARA